LKMGSVYDKMTDTEKEVAYYLEEKGLWWKFEFPVFVYDNKDRPRVWTPDFFIPKLGLFVEVCGSEDYNYEFRRKICDKNGIPVVFLHYYKRPKHWKAHLKKRIEKIQEKRSAEAKKLEDSTNTKK